MKYSLFLYSSICLLQLCILVNSTLLDHTWDGIMLWLCTAIFIVATAIFGLSRQEAKR